MDSNKVQGEATLIMLQCAKKNDFLIYTLIKFQHPERKRIVLFYTEKVDINYSCKMMESIDIPCRHIFHIMKLEQLVDIQ